MSHEPAKCAKCPALITWAASKKTGSRMPVDAAPAPHGNIRLIRREEKWIAEVLGPLFAADARANGESLHLNHFVTCPFSRDFRKPKEAHA